MIVYVGGLKKVKLFIYLIVKNYLNIIFFKKTLDYYLFALVIRKINMKRLFSSAFSQINLNCCMLHLEIPYLILSKTWRTTGRLKILFDDEIKV